MSDGKEGMSHLAGCKPAVLSMQMVGQQSRTGHGTTYQGTARQRTEPPSKHVRCWRVGTWWPVGAANQAWDHLTRHGSAAHRTAKQARALLAGRYTVTGGRSMHYVYQQLACCETCTTCKPFGLSAWIIVFAAAQLLLTQVRSWVLQTVCSMREWVPG